MNYYQRINTIEKLSKWMKEVNLLDTKIKYYKNTCHISCKYIHNHDRIMIVKNEILFCSKNSYNDIIINIDFSNGIVEFEILDK